MSENKVEMPKLKLPNVRLSFPSLFRKAVFEGAETKFEATFLIHKDEQADLFKQVQAYHRDFLRLKFGKDIPKGIKNTFLIDGDEKDYDGYENHWAIKATNNSRVPVFDSNAKGRSPIAEEDGIVYAGCYVNALLGLWYSNHQKGGKQILANLFGVQFCRNGEPFSGNKLASDSDFEDFEDFDDNDYSEDFL